MTIAQASSLSGLSSDTLRYYERIGLITDVKRKSSGVRDYSDQNLKRIQFIRCMRSAGMPLEVLIEYVHLFQEGEHTVSARKELLVEQKKVLDKKITELNETREKLLNKIKNYESIILQREKELLQGETEIPEEPDISFDIDTAV